MLIQKQNPIHKKKRLTQYHANRFQLNLKKNKSKIIGHITRLRRVFRNFRMQLSQLAGCFP